VKRHTYKMSKSVGVDLDSHVMYPGLCIHTLPQYPVNSFIFKLSTHIEQLALVAHRLIANFTATQKAGFSSMSCKL